MVLSDVDIRRYIAEGKIKIDPELPEDHFGSCSIDFRLGNEFSVFEHSKFPFIDPRDKFAIQGMMRTIVVEDGEPFILQPRDFVLAITMEALDLADDVLGRLEGRSPGCSIRVGPGRPRWSCRTWDACRWRCIRGCAFARSRLNR